MRNQLFTPIIFLLFYQFFVSNLFGQVRQKMNSTIFQKEIAGKNWVNSQIDDAHKKEIKIFFSDSSKIVISINMPSYTDILEVVNLKIKRNVFYIYARSEIKGDLQKLYIKGYLSKGILFLNYSKFENKTSKKWLPFQITKD
jgi:hypothetical protein